MVYLVGAGPGDPELVTVKGLHLIRTAAVLLYDSLIPPALLQEAQPTAKVVYVGSRFGDSSARRRQRQERIVRLMVAHSRAGRSVVRLKGGDPLLFGRGGEEAAALADRRIPFEIIPGITSALGAAAYAGIPVTHRDHSSLVVVTTGRASGTETRDSSSIRWLARLKGTRVFLMGLHSLPSLVDRLLRSGASPHEPAAAIEWGTTPRQRVVTAPLSGLSGEVRRSGFDGPTVVIVGDVVRLRSSLAWFDRKRLFGRTVLVTRPLDQSTEIVKALEREGATVLSCPAIRTDPIPPGNRTRRLFRSLSQFDFVIFTSANGVRLFFRQLRRNGLDARSLADCRTICIGPETTRALEAHGVLSDRQARDFRAEGILRGLSGVPIHGKRILIPRALEARELLPDQLRRRGAIVEVVPLYRTRAVSGLRNRIRSAFNQHTVDCVTFTSSSTVREFFEHAPKIRRRFLAACIGPITARTLKEVYRGPSLVAKVYTAAGLVDALVRHYRGHSSPARS